MRKSEQDEVYLETEGDDFFHRNVKTESITTTSLRPAKG